MGCLVERTDTGVWLDVHLFDTKADAESYLTKGRGYKFDRHEPWANTEGFDFYQGPEEGKRAAIRQAPGGYWKAVLWEQSK